MYKVQVEHECGCFKKSEYNNNKSFENQQDAYQYAKILEELMNEEFCKKHLFFVQKAEDELFMVRVVDNPNAGGSCSTGSCGTGCGC
jgi:hypothetical protein